MKFRKLIVMTAVFSAGAMVLPAQETNEVQELKQEMRQMQENFERTQREQSRQMEILNRKLDELTREKAAEAETKRLEQQVAADLQHNQPATSPPALWSPAQPLTIAHAGSAYM